MTRETKTRGNDDTTKEQAIIQRQVDHPIAVACRTSQSHRQRPDAPETIAPLPLETQRGPMSADTVTTACALPDAELRLTSFSHGGGCGCKIAPGVLSEILRSSAGGIVPKELLVGIETADDAAVYQLNDEQALIATTAVTRSIRSSRSTASSSWDSCIRRKCGAMPTRRPATCSCSANRSASASSLPR
ncbi:MAG: hypothetical protein ABI156_04380 [Caldimonas sp.]